MLDAGPLALIVRAGAGVNTIDVAGASARGIYVSNCPGKNAVAVAELALGLILALDRRIPDNVAELRAGTWNKKVYAAAKGLHGRTLGLLGFGNIGQEVAIRARAFGMPVVVWSRRFAADAEERARVSAALGLTVAATPEEVVRAADVLSIHLALAKDTRGFVDAALLSHLRPGDVRDQHRPGRSGRPGGARRGDPREGAARRARRVRRRADRGHRPVRRRHRPAARRLRHAPHRRLDRSGPGSDRGRDRAHRPDVQGDRPRSQRGEPGPTDAGDAHAGGAAPRSSRRAGPRVRRAPRRRAQRAGDREHHLRGRAGRRGPHQPRRRACRRHRSPPFGANADVLDVQLVSLVPGP